ncbi:DUF5693 family protein [Paenibacillus thalictri]|uniref:Uncharacterized protein n=1 Tax=Paenibacillus thalictri TaxID=2527873 RepID=A0A4Q9DMF7_9BACL|nr:DUF5693 family protein [Paenibacillus thalictri]TBL72976.1 hypothetical protein EYB31_27505 [Paenibacillus thalictri]
MIRRYEQWNRRFIKPLWWLVIIGMLASVAVVYERVETEQTTARKVEFVFDYRDLLEISDLQGDPHKFVLDQLDKMKKAGIHSLAVYESTLSELKLSRRVEVFSTHEAMALTQSPISQNENFTYVLFAEKESQQRLQPLIENTFNSLGVRVRPWSFKNQPGMIIEMGMEEALLKTMDPDPITLQMLKEKGFQIVVRMSNRRPFDAANMDKLLAQLKGIGVKRFIIDGETVPGFIDDSHFENIDQMAELMTKYNMGLAAIELLKAPQRGFNRLAKEINYDVVRLHSFTEADGQKLTENLTQQELQDRVQGVADRFVLAVKDRNIRMVFLNARAVKNVDKGKILNPLDALYDSLNGADGALNRVKNAGYTLGIAERFWQYHSVWQPVAKALLVIGAVALIALMISYFVSEATLALFVLGLIGSAGLYILPQTQSMFQQALALGAGISAPSLAMMFAIRTSKEKYSASRQKLGASALFAIGLLLRTTLTSLIGVLFIAGLLNQITYSLVIQQFRGVSALHIVPIIIAVIYYLFFTESTTYSEKWAQVRKLLSSYISVLWVITAAIVAAAGMYYLSRTGNEGQASAFEKLFRSFLENTLGVRPRTKEFLFAHPVFLLGAFLAARYRGRGALILILVGVIGQASVVDTFAHLHTPVLISLTRITYGIIFGSIIGYVIIAVWEIAARRWQAWVKPAKR